MAVLTIFNHGTGNDHHFENHDITLLYKSALARAENHVMYTDGVGSDQSMVDDALSLNHSGLAAKIGGITVGYGMSRNVSAAVDWVAERQKNYKDVNLVNICGYSRGAVASFKQANAMSKHDDLKKIPVRIFAIDPVPGCMGQLNSHVYKNIELEANVKECTVILAENERRKIFRPVLHAAVLDQTATMRWDRMPGNHKGIVEQEANVDAPLLIYDLARNFLEGRDSTIWTGTATYFRRDDWPMSEDEILGRYSKIMLEFEVYYKMGQGVDNVITGRALTMDRVVLQKRKDPIPTRIAKKNWSGKGGNDAVILKSSKGGINATRFFANNHHRAIFQKKYLGTYQILSNFEMNGNPYDTAQESREARETIRQALSRFDPAWVRYVNDHIAKFLGLFM
jgi:hypothetical protein